MKDSPNLDLLRAIAVVLVVGCHLAFEETGNPGVFLLGHLGVALFFVHTTLVLMLSLERTGGSAPAFFVRRFFRIYPLSASVVLLVTLWDLASGMRPVSIVTVLSNLFLVQNITEQPSVLSPLWTLPYEVQMYLLLPMLFVLVRSRRSALWVWAGSLLLLVAFASAGWTEAVALVKFFPCFLAGIVAYKTTAARRLSPLWLFGLVAAAGAVESFMATQGSGEFRDLPLLWFACLCVGAVIPYCREITNPLLVRIAKVIATYSYSIYVLHQVAINVAYHWTLPAPARWAVFAALLVALTGLAYHFIEVPGIALGKRLAGLRPARGSLRPGPLPASPQPPAN